MDNWSAVAIVAGMAAVAISALLIVDNLHYQLAYLRWQQYRAQLAQMQLIIDALRSSNEVLLAMHERHKQAQDLSEFEEVLQKVEEQ